MAIVHARAVIWGSVTKEKLGDIASAVANQRLISKQIVDSPKPHSAYASDLRYQACRSPYLLEAQSLSSLRSDGIAVASRPATMEDVGFFRCPSRVLKKA
jgi:hypothetical protein